MKRLLLGLTAVVQISLRVFAEESVLPKVAVKGLFKGAAVLEINGRQLMMKDGETSSEGVILVNATSKRALIELGGQRSELELSQSIGTSYTEASHTEVRLSGQHQGHFFGSARINGYSVQFMVDTGASSVAMSSAVANKIRLPYKNGQVIRVDTAQGVTKGFRVNLRRVEVGGLSVDNVAAIVLEGEYPLDVLLGNSFLSKTDMNIEGGVLVLKSKY